MDGWMTSVSHPYTPRGLLREALLEGLRNQSVGGLSFRQLVATFEALGRLHLNEEGVIQVMCAAGATQTDRHPSVSMCVCRVCLSRR